MRAGLALVFLGALTLDASVGFGQQNPRDLTLPGTAQIGDAFTPLLPQDVTLQGGFLGKRVDANASDRMLQVDENDLMDAFERRDMPHQDWQGEHVGKFLHAAVLTWNYTHSAPLKAKIDRVVARLLNTQEPDGYLGTYTTSKRWTSWDVWVHKYDLLGLLAYYQFTSLANHDQPTALGQSALTACRKIGDLLANTFGTEPGKRDLNKAGEHRGMAPDSVLEPIVLLYRATRIARYLKFAEYIVANYNAPGGPEILASLESTGSVRAVANAKAYEMTSNFNGLLELYRATGEKRLLRLMEVAWEDIVRHRLYITGGTSSFELFQDEFKLPNTGASDICETCVSVTWEQMNLQLLRITGNSKFADQLELTVYNHLLAAQKPVGGDWAYYTPLEGQKPYDSATTCCHSSGPRGVALIPCVAAMTTSDGGLAMNLYNRGTYQARLKGGGVTVTETTQYPFSGNVKFAISPTRSGLKFPLRLRIPASIDHYRIAINGRSVVTGERSPGSLGYARLDRVWRKGDVVSLEMTLTDRVILGDHENAGKAALMHGPLVLALDEAENAKLATLDGVSLGSRGHILSSSDLHFRGGRHPNRVFDPGIDRRNDGDNPHPDPLCGRRSGRTKPI